MNLTESILSQTVGNLYWKDINGKYLGCNDAFGKILKLNSRNEIVGKNDYDFLPKEIASKIAEIDRKVILEGKEVIAEEIGNDINGNQVIYLTKKVPLYDKKNNIVGLIGTSLDITELKRTQKELQETREKLDGMTLVAASIAHELRTPLASIASATATINETVPYLIDAYNKAKESNLPVHKFNAYNLKILEAVLKGITSETDAANLVINMLLMNLQPTIEDTKNETFSITKCVEEALKRYPYQPGEIKLVFFNEKSPDFMVNGNQSFITHVLFNLLRNALYYLAKSGKPSEETRIEIWLEKDKAYNKLYFKDTGTGMPPEVLDHIFDRFFSKTYHGAGIGLTFCKMVMEALGGSIKCESVEGEYTLFTLAFPQENVYNK